MIDVVNVDGIELELDLEAIAGRRGNRIVWRRTIPFLIDWSVVPGGIVVRTDGGERTIDAMTGSDGVRTTVSGPDGALALLDVDMRHLTRSTRREGDPDVEVVAGLERGTIHVFEDPSRDMRIGVGQEPGSCVPDMIRVGDVDVLLAAGRILRRVGDGAFETVATLPTDGFVLELVDGGAVAVHQLGAVLLDTDGHEVTCVRTGNQVEDWRIEDGWLVVVAEGGGINKLPLVTVAPPQPPA